MGLGANRHSMGRSSKALFLSFSLSPVLVALGGGPILEQETRDDTHERGRERECLGGTFSCYTPLG